MPIHVDVIQTGPSTTRAEVRGHALAIDRPAEKGGADEGPMGGELLLAALGGCFASNLLAAVRGRDADVRDVRVAVAADPADGPPRFTAIRLHASAATDDAERFAKLVAIAERGCLVANTLAGGVPVSVTSDVRPT